MGKQVVINEVFCSILMANNGLASGKLGAILQRYSVKDGHKIHHPLVMFLRGKN